MRAALVLLMLAGCTERVPGPEEPIWGKQQCAHCAMLVSEKAPAAQLLTAEGKRRFFDDLGCMVAFEEREHPKVAARWVRTPADDGWVDPATVKFSGGKVTPMDFGFLSQAQGPLTFEEVRTAVNNKARAPHPDPLPRAGERESDSR